MDANYLKTSQFSKDICQSWIALQENNMINKNKNQQIKKRQQLFENHHS